jgi:uncharacterized protein (DUF302 family)
MLKNTAYYKTVEYQGSIDQAIKAITISLSNEGFGIVTKINVDETLKKKLNVDFPRYQILGACNPAYAYKALLEEKEIGLLLPCNVIIYDDNNQTYISVIKPTAALFSSEKQKINEIAVEIEEKLNRVLQGLISIGIK